MNLYQVEFDATTYIVMAENENDLFIILHERDKGFQKEVDRGIVYMWNVRNIDSVEVTKVDQHFSGIVFTVSH